MKCVTDMFEEAEKLPVEEARRLWKARNGMSVPGGSDGPLVFLHEEHL